MPESTDSIADHRLQQLNSWLQQQIPRLAAERQWGELNQPSLTAASSDASFRRYFRWQSGVLSLVLMDAPPPNEDCRPFIKVAEQLANAGLNVPEILAADVEQGFLILSDLGLETWLQVLTSDNADQLFALAIQALITMQLKSDPGNLPSYDRALLARELNLFPEWYVQHELKQSFTAQQQQLWQQVCELLINNALEQPTTFVHRDYMPRNLMLSAPNPGVLDFQDAVQGPISYDITSLFKDAFISWPEDKVSEWLAHYWHQAHAAGLNVGTDFAEFQRWSDLMGVQRHLKVIGIFARINYRDGKPRYLADTPRFFNYLNTVIARRPELKPLQQLLNSLGL